MRFGFGSLVFDQSAAAERRSGKYVNRTPTGNIYADCSVVAADNVQLKSQYTGESATVIHCRWYQLQQARAI